MWKPPTTHCLCVMTLLLPLTMTGCAVGDGIAHLVKLANGRPASSNDQAKAPAATSAPAPVEPDAPPAPAAAPRDDIKVESLPPQAQDK